MQRDVVIGTALVALGAGMVTSLAYTLPSADAGGPAVLWFYGVVALRGGGGLLVTAVGYVTLSGGRVRLGAVTLTASLVVGLVWATIQLRLFRSLSMPVFTAFAVVVFAIAVGGVYRALSPSSRILVSRSGK
jgi:hypothetical protein